tara:strand:+ start:754 stop:1107 length:354 start_codon:yes stop_codon:yes gene_type:complete
MALAATQELCCCEQNQEVNQISIYQSYTTYISNTIQHFGPFYAITALGDVVIDASECDCGIIEFDSGSKRAITGTLTIPKGVTIYADFASIELDSGSLIAYSRGITGKAKEPTASAS